MFTSRAFDAGVRGGGNLRRTGRRRAHESELSILVEMMEPESRVEIGPEAELEEREPEVKRRRVLCVEFASVAACDAAVAQCYLAENDWEMEVRFSLLPARSLSISSGE